MYPFICNLSSVGQDILFAFFFELFFKDIHNTHVNKLTKDATPEELKEAGLGAHYADHDKALFYHNAAGEPFSVKYIQAKGDPIADLYEDIAAEEKARATYQWLIDMSDDPDINDSLRFLREREVIHSQRFREAVEILKECQDQKKYF